MSTVQVTNLKTDLYKNYYDKTDEPTVFLEWLMENTSYSNGVWRFHTSHINHESEQTDSGNGWTNLKVIVASWARSRYNKQEAWNNWLNERLEYTNGRFYLDTVNNDYIKQTITGYYSQETSYMGEYVYLLSVECKPSLNGQRIVFDENYPLYYTIDDNDGLLRIYFFSNRVLTDPLHVHVECETGGDGKVYSGGSASINPR